MIRCRWCGGCGRSWRVSSSTGNGRLPLSPLAHEGCHTVAVATGVTNPLVVDVA